MTILEHCNSLNSVQKILDVLGVVDMCHLLLRIILFLLKSFYKTQFASDDHARPSILAFPVLKSLKVEQTFFFSSFTYFMLLHIVLLYQRKLS